MASAIKRCVCSEPVIREVTSYGGEVLAVFCSLCTRPMIFKCPVCRKEYKDLKAHFRTKIKCWREADPAAAREYAESKSGKLSLENQAETRDNS